MKLRSITKKCIYQSTNILAVFETSQAKVFCKNSQNVRTFYSRKETQHRILGIAINQLEEDQLENAYVIITGPSTGD